MTITSDKLPPFREERLTSDSAPVRRLLEQAVEPPMVRATAVVIRKGDKDAAKEEDQQAG